MNPLRQSCIPTQDIEVDNGTSGAYSAAAAGCLRHGVVDSCPGPGEAEEDTQGEI